MPKCAPPSTISLPTDGRRWISPWSTPWRSAGMMKGPKGWWLLPRASPTSNRWCGTPCRGINGREPNPPPPHHRKVQPLKDVGFRFRWYQKDHWNFRFDTIVVCNILFRFQISWRMCLNWKNIPSDSLWVLHLASLSVIHARRCLRVHRTRAIYFFVVFFH